MNIIQQLKANEKPFGLMSVEMQEKAREIECGAGDWFQRFSREWADTLHIGSFAHSIAYRLRPNYGEKPEIRLMEIVANMSNCLCMYDDEGQHFGSVAMVHERADFAGFLFKPVFGEEVYMELWLNLDVEHNGTYEVTHASHVRFRS